MAWLVSMLVCRVLSLWLGIIVVGFTRVCVGMVHGSGRLIACKSLFGVMCSASLVLSWLLCVAWFVWMLVCHVSSLWR